MKISNFKHIETTGKNALSWRFIATVDVTTGLFFKHTETVEVQREYGSTYWRFTSSGEHTPDFCIENLEKSYEMKHRKEIQFIEAGK